MIMRSADKSSGENTGGSEPASGVPAASKGVECGPGTAAGSKTPVQDPHDLTPYLALVISTYGATKSLPATAVAAVIAVLAAIMNRR
jgi:hypothetical protein